jgi:hypothetical protein
MRRQCRGGEFCFYMLGRGLFPYRFRYVESLDLVALA